MCNENGGTVDDLIVYKRNENDYFVVVNADNREKDYSWICSHKRGNVTLSNVSDDYGQLALQGPLAPEILAKVTLANDIPEGYYTCKFDVKIGDIDCMISRTGYTGEDGFEIYMSADNASEVWEMLMNAGKEYGIIPCGLGARDTLRMESAMPLYGHEMNDEISPKTAGLGFAVKMKKADFIGKEALEDAMPLKTRRIGLKATGRGIMREGCDVYMNDEKIGVTTSGTYLPYLKGAYALALVDADHREIGSKVQVDVRGRKLDAEIVKLPFYKRSK